MSSIVINPFPQRGHQHEVCVQDALAKAEAHCRERGLRLTPLRRRVLATLWRSHGPTKAYEIINAIGQADKLPAPPTIYRALAFLVEAGLGHRLASHNAFVGCAAPGMPHTGQFLICRCCDQVAEFEDHVIEQAVLTETRRAGFAADLRGLELEGLCNACRAQTADS